MTDPPADRAAPAGSAADGAHESASQGGSSAHAGAGPPMRADPGGPPPTDWREPPWLPRDRGRKGKRDREHGRNFAAVVVGLIVVLVGVYYFLDRTLGIPMPPIAWGSLWPVLLILLGGLILLRAAERRR